MKKRVTSIGGVFFKTKDPKATKEWYAKHLGFNTDEYGTSFEWRKVEAPEEKGFSAWSPMQNDTTYFAPSEKQFMINYRVEDIAWLVEELKKEGVIVCDAIETFEYGKFVHIMDNDGNKIELWEADDAFYGKMVNGKTTK
jgi:predicted enzyme related to lactoylglutathione lyase